MCTPGFNLASGCDSRRYGHPRQPDGTATRQKSFAVRLAMRQNGRSFLASGDKMNATATFEEHRGSGAATTLALCFFTSVIEGLDLQSMGIAAPKLGPEFHLSKELLGYVLMASPAGLLFGALQARSS
jgi:hypothetical protein